MDDHLILEIENVVPEDVCKEIIEKFENEPQKRQSGIVSGFDSMNGRRVLVDLDRRNGTELSESLCKLKHWTDINNKLEEYFLAAYDKYCVEYLEICKKQHDEPQFMIKHLTQNKRIYHTDYYIQRVEPDTWFKWHHDSDYGSTILSCILYLDSRNLEDGGRTKFINGREILPKAGKMLLFPATWAHIHCGTIVKNKPKYICTSMIKLAHD